MSYTIVGVIGHIDHGKTSLVAALTGVNTDTHPEEKRRGITIDLGFASFTDGDHRFALIDAPGHQKYIGNLLAGVSAVDIGLLVVACDQGIQAQTLEHAAILQSLGVKKLIVAISRIDLCDKTAQTELSEELDLFLADFGFAEVPKVAISTVTGEGIAELKEMLRAYARGTDRSASTLFRMPIDRVFTIEGRGCVVAGTIWSGTIAVGDHVQLSPAGEMFRIRELEVHDEIVTESRTAMRTAINLAGASAADISRGDELVAPSTHPASSRVIVQMRMFRDATELRCPATVQLHTATTSCSARISGVKKVGPGECAVVIVDTETPIISTFSQQCLFRRPYPVGSFAGGRILGALERRPRQTALLLTLGRQLAEGNPADRLAAWVDYLGEMEVDPQRFELQLGIAADMTRDVIEQCVAREFIQFPRKDYLVSSRSVDRIRAYLLKILRHRAETTEDAWLNEDAIVRRAASTGSAEVVRFVIQTLMDEHLLVRVNQMIAAASEQTILSKKQRSRMEQLLEMYRDSRKPPTSKEAAARLETTIDNVASLIRFATQQRLMIDLENGFFIGDEVFRVLCCELRDLFAQSREQSVADIRDRWQITRKHAIPLLEYCDRVGITIRQEDVRFAGPALDQWLPEPVPKGQTIE